MSERITIPLYRVGWSSEAPLSDVGQGHLLACKNYIIKQNLVESRKGYFPVLSFSKPVKTMIPLPEYKMLIVCSDDDITVYQESSDSFTQVATKGGYSTSEWRWAYMNHQIIMVNGQDNAQQISVSNPFEQTQAVTIADWAVTGTDSKIFDWISVLNAQVCAGFGNDMSAWYLPVGYVQGTLKQFDLSATSGTFKKGGSIVAGFNISRDAGMSLNAYIGFLTDQGEAIVYSGNDLDDATNIEYNGTYQTGYPLGKTPFINWSGDLIIMTNKGFISAHSIFANGENQNAQYIFSQRINTWLLDQATKFGKEYGFMGAVVPTEDFVLFNIPQGGGCFVQVCMNITSGKWSLFNSINAYTMCVFDGRLLFGMSNGVFQYGTSELDKNFIPLEIWTSYTNCGNENLKRINLFQLRHSSSDKINLSFAVYKDFENQSYYNWTDTSDVINSIAESGFVWSNYNLPDDPTPGTAQWQPTPVDGVATYAELLTYDTTGLADGSIIDVASDTNHSDNQAYYAWVITEGVGAWAYIGSETDSEYWAGGYGDMTPSADTHSASGLGHNFSIRMTANVNGIKHQVVDLMLLFNTSKTAV